MSFSYAMNPYFLHYINKNKKRDAHLWGLA